MLLYGENCVILVSTVFDWSTRVTDGRTDSRTDGHTELPWHICAIAYMLSRVKTGGALTMASAEREPTTGVWGGALSGSRGTAPGQGSGGNAPWSWKLSEDRTSKGRGKLGVWLS